MSQTRAESATGDAPVPPPHVDSISYLAWRSHVVLRRVLDNALMELGVNVAQVGLAGHLIQYGLRAVADLARIIGLTPQGTALAVSQLRKLGWVAPSHASGRGRAVLLEITEEGRESYLKAVRIIEQVEESVTSGITPAERAAARKALAVIAGYRS